MSSLKDISNERELRIVHDTEYGLISVKHFDAYQNEDFTIHIKTEDFVKMLEWYFYQKEKDENYETIQWNEDEQFLADRLVSDYLENKSVDILIKNAKSIYEQAKENAADKANAGSKDGMTLYNKIGFAEVSWDR